MNGWAGLPNPEMWLELKGKNGVGEVRGCVSAQLWILSLVPQTRVWALQDRQKLGELLSWDCVRPGDMSSPLKGKAVTLLLGGGGSLAVSVKRLKKPSNTGTQWFSFPICPLEEHPHLPIGRHIKNGASGTVCHHWKTRQNNNKKWKERKPLQCWSINKPHLFCYAVICKN